MKRSISRPQSIEEKAYSYVRGKILSGEIPPGAAISEASIARELGNSRGPLREAVRRLTAEGLLRQTPKGSVVTEFSRRDIAELYELREALEVYAVGKAAERGLGGPELETMEASVRQVLLLRDELEAAGAAQLDLAGMRRFIRIDLQFHTLLVRAAANARMYKVCADTRVLLNIFALRRTGHDPAQLTEIHRFHSDILAAVARRDPKTAQRLLGEHIRLSRDERLKEYDEWERETALAHPLPDLFLSDLS